MLQGLLSRALALTLQEPVLDCNPECSEPCFPVSAFRGSCPKVVLFFGGGVSRGGCPPLVSVGVIVEFVNLILTLVGNCLLIETSAVVLVFPSAGRGPEKCICGGLDGSQAAAPPCACSLGRKGWLEWGASSGPVADGPRAVPASGFCKPLRCLPSFLLDLYGTSNKKICF